MKTKTMLWLATMAALMLLCGQVYARSDVGRQAYHIDLNKPIPTELATNLPTVGGSSAGDVNGTFVPSTRYNETQLIATNLPTVGGSSAGDVNGTFVPSTRYNETQLIATNLPTVGGSSAGDVNGTFVPSTRYYDAT